MISAEGADAGGIRGWGCTPTGDPPPAAVPSNNTESTNKSCFPASLAKGWRRTALYGILIFLMILVFLNIALTLWIISTLKLSMKGIGPIKIVNGGIQLQGQAWLTDQLIASSISSQPAQPITMHSHRNFTVLVSEPGHLDHAKLLIKRDSIECSGRAFDVRDSRGGSVFHASKDEVRVSAETLAVEGEGGVTVRGALQAPAVRAPPGSDLLLESLTRRLDLRAPQSISIESRAGNIDVTSHSDIKLDSIVGAIRLNAPNIVINHLKQVNATARPHKNIRNTKVYQLCACASGRLFLALPEAPCASSDIDTDLCR